MACCVQGMKRRLITIYYFKPISFVWKYTLDKPSEYDKEMA
jgi:hypothetical protein